MSPPGSPTSSLAEDPSHSGPHPRRRRRSRAGSVLAGRLYLAGFLAMLTICHAWLYLTIQDWAKPDYLAHEVPLFCITVSLFAGVVCRQFWARYLLIAFLMFRVGSSLIFLPSFLEAVGEVPALVFRVLLVPVMDTLIIWGLIAVPSIRRLVSRNYE